MGAAADCTRQTRLSKGTSSLNRSRFIERDFQGEGSERSQALAIALAQIADPELLEALVHHIAALHEFGGEVYIGAARDRFEVQGERLVKVTDGGSFLTFGHVIAYNKKARIKGQQSEPDAGYEQQPAPQPEPAPEPNGDGDPESVPVPVE
jgi:hypothetical protein